MKTALFDQHQALGARMVDFGGWRMPLHYGSQVAEHHAVRNKAGIFDVSHMLPVDFEGPDAVPVLQLLLASDVSRLQSVGQALYTVMLNENGGIIDDLIVYRLSSDRFRIIFNAATSTTDVQWVESRIPQDFEVEIQPRRDLNIVAVQGPEALTIASKVVGGKDIDALKPFTCVEHDQYFIGRTGYTGEDGVEILCATDAVHSLWKALIEEQLTPCGLGARDTLRLEAGLNLYGQDMTSEVSPLESALEWVVHWEPIDRSFIGRERLQNLKAAGAQRKLTGVVLERGIMRAGQEVQTGLGNGVITSGTYSPTLGYSIALARVPKLATGDCKIDIRGRLVDGRLVRPPFVRKGRKVHK